MVSLVELWMPALVSGVAVFFAGFLAWRVMPHHRGDWSGFPDEKKFYEAMGTLGIKPGSYMFPWCHGVE